MVSLTDSKVIAHLLDGTLLRGHTADFYPDRPKFQLTTVNGEVHRLHVNELKALFFVRDFRGRPDYKERKGFFETSGDGSKVLVEFFDGEVLFGYTLSYSSDGFGFFVIPGDPESNNIKVFVVHAATKRVKVKVRSSRGRKKVGGRRRR